jgi:hypothetical protein
MKPHTGLFPPKREFLKNYRKGNARQSYLLNRAVLGGAQDVRHRTSQRHARTTGASLHHFSSTSILERTMDQAMHPADGGSGPDAEPRLVSVNDNGGATHYHYQFSERPPRAQVEHDREKRVFRIARPNGTTTVFRDEPVRFLVAVRNPETG